MNQMRGVLFLADPRMPAAPLQKHIANTTVKTLTFDEGGRYLSLAQAALWRMRLNCTWVCVAAEGGAAAVALALAAQLPVDRLALMGSGIFIAGAKSSGPARGGRACRKSDFAVLPREEAASRELMRLKRYARRNLALVVSEMMLVNAPEEEIRGLMWGMGRRKVCALECGGWDGCLSLLAAPWSRVCEKNLLIP